MKNNRFWTMLLMMVISIMLTSCGAETSAPPAAEKPNIVLIVGDDHGYPYFGFMGADYVQTPHMDRLANSGTVFKHGYVPSNHCRPSLQTLMTGTLPIQYKNTMAIKMAEIKQTDEAYQKQDEAGQRDWERNFGFHAMQYAHTLPRMLKTAGYTSFQGGKWWEFNYQNGGFDTGMTSGWTKEDETKDDWFLKFMGGDGTELGRTTMQPVYDFIDANSEEPFFIWYAPELPHYPFDSADKYREIYKDKGMTESAQRYYANCTWFDDGVGDLVNYLKEKGEFENTLFVYVNDNGWEQNPDQEFRHDSLRWHNGGDKGKLSMYDQSFRSPIIFSWQDKIPAGKSTTALMHSADVLPTILDFAGLEVPKDIYGQTYRSVLEGKAEGVRESVIGRVTQLRSEADMMGRRAEGYWLRRDNWFFQWNLTDKTQFLFDIATDPENNQDVAADHPKLVEGFVQEINSWRSAMAAE